MPDLRKLPWLGRFLPDPDKPPTPDKPVNPDHEEDANPEVVPPDA